MLHEINDPVGIITPSHPCFEIGLSDEELNTNWPKEGTNPNQPEVSEPEKSESETSDSEQEEMGDTNFDDNHNANNQPWLLRDALAIPGRQHRLPRHPEKLLPIFNPNSKEPVEYHIQKFMLANCLMSVQAEDVACRLFPYMF